MYKTISYWTAATQDIEAFEEYYQQVHGPVAARVPGVQKLELSRASDGFAGEPSPFYRVAEMYFDDREAMERATHPRMGRPWRKRRAPDPAVRRSSQDWPWPRCRGSADTKRTPAHRFRRSTGAPAPLADNRRALTAHQASPGQSPYPQ